MALVDEHQVVLVDGRHIGGLGSKEHAFHEPLDGADVHAGVGIDVDLARPFRPKMSAKALALTTFVVVNSFSVCVPRALRSTTKQTRRKRLVASRR